MRTAATFVGLCMATGIALSGVFALAVLVCLKIIGGV